jgi:methylmalonyl-CoA mutase N-terminal domain/subunit
LVKKNLEALKKAASHTENTVPHLVECVKAYATEGEIVNALKEVYGEYREPAWF